MMVLVLLPVMGQGEVRHAEEEDGELSSTRKPGEKARR